ncbi:proteophosphoglycan ppg4 [Colletotrichum musicola]|uniref:Proteophosphoglycan ppg4 n=1 Tax=Colletotrichum musicola TaxID=2175873 RepID=A0A8H6NV90_9PEZI|nr:proteophosphoglycan ppg4 [Colletotrichum musicola]
MLSPEVDRMSRASSMTWEDHKAMDQARQLQVESWHIPGNRQSINYNLMSYESRRLLNLNEDLTACEENSIMSESKFEARFEVSRNTWKSSHPLQPASTQIARANSDVSLYAPVRRRSMIQTPGLATRINTDCSASRRSSFRHSMPATPAGGRSRMNSIDTNLQHIATLDEFVSEHEDDLPELLPVPVSEPFERALTPSDMDYRPLGAMKFGSLRITNGAASPIPSPDFEPPTTGGWTAEPEQLGESDGMHHKITATNSLRPIETSSHAVESSRSGSTSPLSPELKVASKHTAMEDALFDDDVQMEYSAEVLSVRNDPNAKPSLEQLQADQSQKNRGSVVRADSGIVASPTTEYQPKPLSKADSGYSSNVSLRSFHAKQPSAGKDQLSHTVPKDAAEEKSDANSSPAAGISITIPALGLINSDSSATDGTSSASSTPPPLPPKDDYLRSQSGNTMTATSTRLVIESNAAQASRKELLTVDKIRSPRDGPHPNSALSIGSGARRTTKLQRFLSGAGMRGPPVVHDTHPADEAIPSVPQPVQARFEEHSARFPLSSKRLTLRAQASKDTLKTIFSVGSFDAGEARRDPSPAADRKAVASKPASPSDGPAEMPKTPRRPSFQVPSSIAHAAASVMPRRSIHRKPVPGTHAEKSEYVGEARADEIQVGFETAITDIGNAGESPSKSAFDQAFMALPRNEDAPKPAGRTFTMTAQMERTMGMHLRRHDPMPSTDLLPSPNSQQFSDEGSKRKTSPPVSLHTRSGKNLRKPVTPVRPQSSSGTESSYARRQSFSRQSSRENIRSYPSASPGTDDDLTVPPIPPMSPRRTSIMLEQQQGMRRQPTEDKWRPTNRRASEFGPPIPRPAMRSASALSPGLSHPQLRHRASYDDHVHQYQGPIARGPQPGGHAASQGGSYYQHQLQRIQHEGWENHEYYSPDSIQPGLSRRRSRSRSVHAHSNPPYRVLHSYNSPAYRNVPIWG